MRACRFYRSNLHRLLIPQFCVAGAWCNNHTFVASSQPSRLCSLGERCWACCLPRPPAV